MNIVTELNEPYTAEEWWKFIFEYKYVQGLKIIETNNKIIAYKN